ncbi:Tether containing UBX domain for GLUT4 [Grifola frondosa]|uniref:Tether containing UBX domain for GLUT4 n=1 Tax=Grifola frondosa TaxID=5627 RepID=A0A1C7M8C7_GRIFR|nr:Tether containing UBX domain for GLUT4 [Grifola frondosa]
MSSNTESAASTSATQQANPSPQPQEPPAFRFYRPPRSALNTPHELPDSYFTPTTADLKAAQASLSARAQALANAPLRTQAMRDADEKAKRARWPHTTIRVKFSDRSQLEKTSLREDVKPIKFVLYQTPPKREFKVSDPEVRDLSLVDLQLAPSSVLMLKFEDDALNHSGVSAPLDPSVLAKAEDLPVPPDFDEGVATSGSSSSASPATSSGPSIVPKEVKVPKWLKLGGKK